MSGAVALAASSTAWGLGAGSDTGEQELGALEAELRDRRRLAAQADALTSAARSAEVRLRELRRAAPGTSEVGGVLRELPRAATAAGLVVRGFAVQPMERGDTHDVWPARLQIDGTYAALRRLLAEWSESPGLLAVRSLRLAGLTPPRPSATLHGDLVVVTYTARPAPEGEPVTP